MKNDAVILGVKPRRGMWLIHRERGRIYGPIWRVRSSGEIETLGYIGQADPYPVRHDSDHMRENGYEYVTASEVERLAGASVIDIEAKLRARGLSAPHIPLKE